MVAVSGNAGSAPFPETRVRHHFRKHGFGIISGNTGSAPFPETQVRHHFRKYGFGTISGNTGSAPFPETRVRHHFREHGFGTITGNTGSAPLISSRVIRIGRPTDPLGREKAIQGPPPNRMHTLSDLRLTARPME